jgi:hypothetical protein
MPAKSEVLLQLILGFLDEGAAWAPLIDKLGPLSERTLATDFADAGTRAREGGSFTLPQAADAVALIDQRLDARFIVGGHPWAVRPPNWWRRRGPSALRRWCA